MADQKLWTGGDAVKLTYLQIDRKNVKDSRIDLDLEVRVTSGKFKGTRGEIVSYNKQTLELRCKNVVQKTA